jgi:hypothetical protein
MGNMAEAGFYGIMIALVVYAILGSIVALILWGCGKGIGKIENANFGNAWLVVLFATLCNVVLTFLMGAMGADALWLALKLGLIGSMVVQAILVAIFYVVGGKLGRPSNTKLEPRYTGWQIEPPTMHSQSLHSQFFQCLFRIPIESMQLCFQE